MACAVSGQGGALARLGPSEKLQDGEGAGVHVLAEAPNWFRGFRALGVRV